MNQLIKSNIKTIRMMRNLTQEELARKCNVTTRTIQNLEREPNTNILNLFQLKKALNCKSLDELFKED